MVSSLYYKKSWPTFSPVFASSNMKPKDGPCEAIHTVTCWGWPDCITDCRSAFRNSFHNTVLWSYLPIMHKNQATFDVMIWKHDLHMLLRKWKSFITAPRSSYIINMRPTCSSQCSSKTYLHCTLQQLFTSNMVCTQYCVACTEIIHYFVN